MWEWIRANKLVSSVSAILITYVTYLIIAWLIGIYTSGNYPLWQEFLLTVFGGGAILLLAGTIIFAVGFVVRTIRLLLKKDVIDDLDDPNTYN